MNYFPRNQGRSRTPTEMSGAVSRAKTQGGGGAKAAGGPPIMVKRESCQSLNKAEIAEGAARVQQQQQQGGGAKRWVLARRGGA